MTTTITATATETTPIINASVTAQNTDNQSDGAVQKVAQSRFDGIKAFFSNHGKKVALGTVYVISTAALFTIMGPTAFGIGVLVTLIDASLTI